MQQMLLGVGAKKSSVFIDDCFYTHVYTGDGNSSGQNITGSDFEPDLVWIKGRNHSANHILVDSVRGNNKVLYSNTDDDQDTNEDYVNSRFVGGFKVGNSGITNGSNETNVGWTWKKTPGFFDCVQITGDGTGAKAISHNLESIPGLILVKTTGVTGNWFVYHRGVGFSNGLLLNDSYGASFASPVSAVSDTTFTITNAINENGRTYICYVFAGGESNASEARSVDFDGSDDYLSIGSSSDYDYGTGDFCIEGWYLADSLSSGGYHKRLFLNGSSNTDSLQIFVRKDNNKIYFNVTGSPLVSSSEPMAIGQWTHIAVVRYSSVITLYVNGVSVDSASYSSDIDHQSSSFYIGTHPEDSNATWNGKISNFRVVKGSAVYTSSFKPPTEPLTNITNTTILCCNNISVIGSTVTPGTITANSSPTASTDSPFDDPAGFVFGDAGDQNVIKCGTFVPDSSTGKATVNLGWEPQWWMWKKSSGTGGWGVYDSMRGVVTGGNDQNLELNDSAAEGSVDVLSFTPTGVEVSLNAGAHGGSTFIFVALRRPDGYVGKPPELGTGVFAMDTGNGSSDIPAMDSGFPVDFALKREPASSNSWRTTARLMGSKGLFTDTTGAEYSASSFEWDSNVGWLIGASSSEFSWMWKRHAGFDCIAYKGDGVAGRQIPHSLSKTPEMMWIKNRDKDDSWTVYHKGLNGGTNPSSYYLKLNLNASEYSDSSGIMFNQVEPTALAFTLGNNARVNENNSNHLAMLFASVKGISHVGSYTGNGTGQTITIPNGGFQPRFLLLKRTENTSDWFLLDTTRGWGSGNDNYIQLSDSDAQSSYDFGAPTSTGFTLTAAGDGYNANGEVYIYYAHA